MKYILLSAMVLNGLFGIFGLSNTGDPAKWSSRQTDKWFEKRSWLSGWNIVPDNSINRKEFAISYFKNKERWDKAFSFLKNTNLSGLEIRRYDIDGDNLYASVMDYVTKNEEEVRYEAHRKYIDIQYVISGVEEMGVAPLSSLKEVTVPYDASKDVGFMTVTESKLYKATPDRFFIFFPDDIHRPSVKVSQNSPVKKIVVKVRVD